MSIIKTTVFGSGSWGTAIALLLHNNGYDVTLWSKFENEAKTLCNTRRNPLLKDVEIPQKIYITSDLNEAVNNANAAILAVPSYGLRETAEALAERLNDDCVVVCMSKGIEEDSSSLFTSILKETFNENTTIAAVSGPTHAEEVARQIPTACVAASEDISVAMRVQNLLMNDFLRVYTSTDIIGVELGAALKNVIALGAGISLGLGYGDNTMAMLITRGLAEIAELCVKMGGCKETLAGLAGLGDLIVTCMSEYSRNRQAGILIGKGKTTQEAMSEVGAVVEGYYAAKAAKKLAEKMDIDMPISLETYRVLYENKHPMTAMKDLMSRSRRSEQDTGAEIWVT
ncbi:MAG: NAD(P)-dependent glycerol-3-phosphate dehydrogenase [Oscillospiraceae bacterium]|nr:NAD(P)-dependent glycerol-3-phosphate dehydrogenase [Oscillospiraceae bacterium]